MKDCFKYLRLVIIAVFFAWLSCKRVKRLFHNKSCALLLIALIGISLVVFFPLRAEGQFFAVEQTGSNQWCLVATRTYAEGYSTFQAIAANGTVYFAGSEDTYGSCEYVDSEEGCLVTSYTSPSF